MQLVCFLCCFYDPPIQGSDATSSLALTHPCIPFLSTTTMPIAIGDNRTRNELFFVSVGSSDDVQKLAEIIPAYIPALVWAVEHSRAWANETTPWTISHSCLPTIATDHGRLLSTQARAMAIQGHFAPCKISESLITGPCCCIIPYIRDTSFMSSPFLSPDLLRQGRLTPVLRSPRRSQDARRPGLGLRRSMGLAFEGRGPGKANLAEQCSSPLSEGSYAFL